MLQPGGELIPPSGDISSRVGGQRHRGTVKWFNATKGFGFITPEGAGPDGGGEDLFVHQVGRFKIPGVEGTPPAYKNRHIARTTLGPSHM